MELRGQLPTIKWFRNQTLVHGAAKTLSIHELESVFCKTLEGKDVDRRLDPRVSMLLAIMNTRMSTA
jgi:hypothetical protein